MSGTAPVVSTGSNFLVTSGSTTASLATQSSTFSPIIFNTATNPGANALTWGAAGDTTTGLEADLSQASGVTINELREAFQIQKLLERDARGGTRYTEIIHSHFGVVSPDARLQRPEYLGGGSTSVNIFPVANTSGATTNNTAQGTLAPFGTLNLHNCGFVKSFTEHGYIIGLVSVRADLNYQQGLNRMWTRSTRYDFY